MNHKRKRFFLIFLAFLFNLFCSFSQEKTSDAKNVIKYKNLGYSGIDSMKVDVLRTYYLSEKAQKWLYNVLDEGQQYRIYIRNQLEKRKMPAILEYLPLVESEYNPNAKSSSGATGMWQFMTNSVKGLLEYDEYVDQRYDPWKSTEAALTKLNDNYRTFGDWLLAITAYNCGAGALNRAIKKAGSRDFWYLCNNGYLSEQAASYVPKLLAIADVVENDVFYGVRLPHARAWNGTTLETRAGMFDYVTVRQSVPLKKLAYELRIDEETFLSLNSALIKQVTPPDRKYQIRFPEGMEGSATYALNEMGYLTIK